MVNESDIKALIANGIFGKVTYVSSKFDRDADKGIQFASTIYFVKITVNDGNKNVDYNIVIKKPHQTEEVKEFFKSTDVFRNEYIMYTEILPFLNAGKLDIFTKLLLGNVNDLETLVFKNLTFEGYRVTREKVYISYDHLVLVMRKLGEFHGLSHLAKKQRRNEFFKLAGKLIETKFTSDAVCFEATLKPSAERAFQTLIDGNIEVKKLLNDVLEKYDRSIEMADKLLKPEEPFSVICHGDFCRNNIFFKYDNDKPVDVKFFDFQHAVYSSPAVDISFILFLNASAELRAKHWDEFLSIYWQGVISTAGNVEFTFKQFLEHFSKRAIYGFLPTSFFLPELVVDDFIDVGVLTQLTMEQRKERAWITGGDEGTKAISDVAEHLLMKGYLNKFLELF